MRTAISCTECSQASGWPYPYMVGRSSLNVATLCMCSCPSCTPSHRTISFLSTWLCVRYLHIVAYGYCSQQCTWCMVFFKAAISCCMEERCSSCSLAVASLFLKWVCFSWNVASSASSEAIYKLYDTFCVSEVKWNFGHIAFYIHAIRFSCDRHSGTGFCRIFATWMCTGVLYYLIIK